jgi:creatinine amidohydrolase
MEVMGFQAAIFLTGHYGPASRDLETLLGWLQPYCACRLVGLPDSAVNNPGFDPENPYYHGDHAGRVETSQLWAMEPDCVDLSRLPAPDAPGPHFCMGDTAHQANRRTGARMVADQVAALGKVAAEAQAAWTGKPERSDAGFRTYSDVERVWHDEIRPRLSELLIMQDSWDHVGIPRCPDDSTWAANRSLPDLLGNGWG